MIRATFQQAKIQRSADASARSVDVIASTPSLDSEDRIVVQDWDLTRYLKNPVVLWNHGCGGGLFGGASDETTLPIGHASNVTVDENGNLTATLNFVDEKANPLAEQVYQGFLQNSIRAVSVGWNADGVRYDEESDTIILTGNELVEISAVAIPANPEAVRKSAAFVASLRARTTTSERNAKMKVSVAALLAALGASADADEAEVLEGVRELKASHEHLNSLIAAVGGENFHDALGIAGGLKAKAVAYESSANELAKMKAEQQRVAFMATFEHAEREGKITPANRANCLKICGASESGEGGNADTLTALVSSLPVVANRAPAQTAAPGKAVKAHRAPSDEAFKAMGISVDEYAQYQKKQAERLGEGGNQ